MTMSIERDTYTETAKTENVNAEKMNTESENIEHVNRGSINTHSVSTENMNTERVNSESKNTDKMNTESVNTASENTENMNTESVNTENMNTESVSTENMNTHSVNTASENTENMNTENMNTETVNTENMNTERVNTENMNTENMNTERVNTENMNTENMNTETVNTENMNTERVNTENMNTKNMNTENMNTENMNTENMNTESGNSESVNTKCVTIESNNTESRNSESVNTEIVSSESGNSHNVNTENVHTESENSNSGNTESGDASFKEVDLQCAHGYTNYSLTSLQARPCSPSVPFSQELASKPESPDTLVLHDIGKLVEICHSIENKTSSIQALNYLETSYFTPKVTGCTLRSSVSAPNLTEYILFTVPVTTKSSSVLDISPNTVYDTGFDMSSSSSETSLGSSPDPLPDDEEEDGNELIFIECQICLDFESVTLIYTRPCCQFKVCRNCLTNYVSLNVFEGNVVNIECPSTECQVKLTEFDILNCLSSALKMKYHKFLLDGEKNPTRKTCPSCDHDQQVTKKALKDKETKKKGLEITCVTCTLRWCFLCHAPWHEGLTCKEYRRGDEEFQQWAQQQQDSGKRSTSNYNAQKCPACKIYIQRSSGCPHMTCSRCSTEFCYHCGERFFLTDTEHRIYNRRVFRFLLGGHNQRYSVLGCRHLLLPHSRAKRRLVRGSLFGARVVGGVCALGVGAGAVAVAVAVAPVALPIYGAVKLVKKIRSS